MSKTRQSKPLLSMHRPSPRSAGSKLPPKVLVSRLVGARTELRRGPLVLTAGAFHALGPAAEDFGAQPTAGPSAPSPPPSASATQSIYASQLASVPEFESYGAV